ncbi:hypothetical protein BCR39DRAFT_566546 [Naematelia encephala]|uniref:Zn(2)-C6 fungal-type domain-containing protein n=1 Tax=Naematelia encephala TaxID=71784 RepID=A0A1Y2AQ31_9TREE|nr:hypothetical protein BCR39DRAFT_566546 [Naematelia encephala]
MIERDTQQDSVPLKRRRITRACDRCHRGGIKCTPGPKEGTCGSCAAFGSPCTYERPVKRRGPAARSLSSRASSENKPRIPSSRHSLTPDDGWVYTEVASHEVIADLVEVFYKVVYPIIVYFHWPNFIAQIRSRRYMTSRPFFTLTMAVCAMSSARVRDGAHPVLMPTMPSSETFYRATLDAFPTNLSEAPEFDYKRTKALLALVCIQNGHVREMLQHAGDYTTLCTLEGFHIEGRWPPGLDEIQVQERRRLFWAAYQNDVYHAITFGGIVRTRESQSTVLYPAEVLSDDDITPTSITLPPHTPASMSPDPYKSVSFLRGWNFTTDLYRILEHAVERLRARCLWSNEDPSGPVSSLFTRRNGEGPSSEEILGTVQQLYTALPSVFKDIREMCGVVEIDRFGFEAAANIIVTLQTVKMVMAGSEASIEQRCAIARELLDAFARVPTSYVQAESAPMLHHLAGVGHLLGSVIQSPLSHQTYLQVRGVLLGMADLLGSLESCLSSAAGIAVKLRSHVHRIDRYMTEAAQERTWYPPVLPQNLSFLIPQTPPLAIWAPSANLSPAVQFQLPDDLFADWPFDMGFGDAFDFLGSGVGAGLGLEDASAEI